MSDALRRALRTFLQTFLGAFLATNALAAVGEDGAVNADDLAVLVKAGVSAGTAAAVALVAWLQNALEDHTSMPAVLKAPASEGENPVPNDAGLSAVELAVVVLLVIIALALLGKVTL